MKYIKISMYIFSISFSLNLFAHKYEDNTYQAVTSNEDGGVYVINQKTGTVKYCASTGVAGKESFKIFCTKHTK